MSALTKNGAAQITLDGHMQYNMQTSNPATGNGVASNGDSGVWINPDPDYRQSNPLTNVYIDASVWGGASVTILVCPSLDAGQTEDWFQLGQPIIAKACITINDHFAKLKCNVTGATSNTAGLNIWVQ